MRRRAFVQVGAVSALGLTLPDLLASRSRAASQAQASAKACIYLYMTGGPAQQETFDMKPEAPRGEFRPIATDVPGMMVCEHMPLLAQTAGRYTVVRSVHHDNTFHGAGSHWNLTGLPHAPREPTPEFYLDRRDAPCIGAVVEQLQGRRNGLPAAVQLPWWVGHGFVERFAGQHAGFLGPQYDPLKVFYEEKQDLPGILPPSYRLLEGVSAERLSRRFQLLGAMERPSASVTDSQRFSRYQAQAIDVLNSAGAWRAFSLDGEKPQTIERYGNSKFGRSCLVARRLVEAGVSVVNVCWPGHENHFDTHGDHFRTMREDLLPSMDRGCSALLEDLDERGMLEDTLVVWAGEFGRTPGLNGNKPAGRDHWPFVYSVLLAGGGIRRGQVYGSSDEVAGRPKDKPVHVRDLVATIYHALGIGPDTTVSDVLGRQHTVVTGRPVLELF